MMDIIPLTEMRGERIYGDFFKKPPNFVPQIKSWYFFISLFYENETQYLIKLFKSITKFEKL